MVAEYQADELASGSDDERKLEKAERAAEKKATKRKRVTKTGSRVAVARSQQVFAGAPAAAPWARSPGGPPGQHVAVKAQMPLPKLQALMGPCFSCREMGHLKRFFPRLTSAPPRWYPCDDETREQSERDIKGSADSVNDVILSKERECHSWCVCECKDVENVDKISEREREREKSVSCCSHCGPRGNTDNCVCIHVSQYKWDASPSETCIRNIQEQVELESWEYKEDNTVSVKGRLAKNIAYWKDVVQASPLILDTVQFGYIIPFKEEPTKFYPPNQASALSNAEFVSQAIEDLLSDGRGKRG